jgi:hypothetical protein
MFISTPLVLVFTAPLTLPLYGDCWMLQILDVPNEFPNLLRNRSDEELTEMHHEPAQGPRNVLTRPAKKNVDVAMNVRGSLLQPA